MLMTMITDPASSFVSVDVLPLKGVGWLEVQSIYLIYTLIICLYLKNIKTTDLNYKCIRRVQENTWRV